jgi:hypothetical protein
MTITLGPWDMFFAGIVVGSLITIIGEFIVAMSKRDWGKQ